MRRKISTGFLALVLLLQAFIPSLAYAKEAKNNDNEAVVKEEQISNSDLITIGKLKGVGFSKDNPTASISVEKVDQEKNHSTEASNELEFGDEIIPQAVRGSGSPYINGQQPADSDKPKYLANVVGKLTMIGLDGGDFDWDKVLGKDAKINLLFNQFSGNITTGVSFILSIDKDGKYSLFNAERKHDPDKPWEYYWVGSDNKPTELPLYDADGNAYTYSVQTSRSYGENVQLIISETSGTPGSSFRPVGDKHIATIVFNMSIRQVASTKFVSEWNTSVKEADRPQIEGYFKVEDDVDNDFNFPLNNTSETILRDGFLKNFEEGDEETGPWPFLSSELETTPKTVKVKTDTPGLEFNTRWGKKIVTHGDHIYRYDFNYDVINGGKLTMTEIIPVVFNPNGGEFNDNRIEDKDKANDYTVWVEYGGSVYDDVPKEVIKKENTFLGWTLYPEYNPYAEPKSSFENIKTKKTFYALFEKDVKEQDQEQIPGRENYPYTMAHFDLTDKAKIRPEVSGEKVKRHFQVWSKNKVTLPVVEPVGITEKDANGRSFTWKFKYWEEVDGNRKWYVNEEKPYVVDEFLKKDTYIKAVFEKDYTSNNEQVEPYITHESAKDGDGNFINNIQLPTFEDLQKQIKIKKGDNFVAIDTLTDPKEKVTVEYVKGKDASGNEYADFNTEIYDKLQEKENPKENGIEKPTRVETIKAQLTYPDGEVKTVDIPIKVIKNIYEAKTETQRPYYVPKEYVKVTLDPTTKATDPQKTYYYVNPAAKVVIPGTDPTGIGDNKFINWTMKADTATGDGADYTLSERHMFTEASTITAQYSGDIIPQEGTETPDGVPKNFVLVEFKSGTNGTLAGTTKYWVNPAAGKKLSDIAHPSVTANEGWKHTGWDKTENTEIKTALEVTAQYLKKVLTEQPTENADKYVKVDFKPGEHGTLVDGQTNIYWVLKDEPVSLIAPKVTANEGYAQKTGDDAWSPQIEKSYNTDTDHTAQYAYNGKDVIPQPGEEKPGNVPDDFVLVEFNPGIHGTIASTETTKYWVNPTKVVTLTPPSVKANPGYEQKEGFNAWDHYLTAMFSEKIVITAQYQKIQETPPTPPTPPTPGPGGSLQPLRPSGTVTVIEKEIVKVPAEKTFRKEVRYMQGYNNYFRPGAGLTRAEAAQILANALVEDGYRYDPNFAIHYKDIVGNEWYAKAIRITSQANVFKGYDTGYFDPHKKITRAEWIGTLRRFQELERVSGNHMQVRADHWAMGEIEAAYKEGWLAIYGQGLAKFRADEFIPRQEVAAVSNKAFNRVLDKTYIHRNSKNLINYKDVNPSLWSYEDILCASNGFIHDGKSFWGHKVDYKKDLYNINLDGYTVTKDKFQRLERR